MTLIEDVKILDIERFLDKSWS